MIDSVRKTAIEHRNDKGRYHDDCGKIFFLGRDTNTGRPTEMDVDEAMNRIFKTLEEGDGRQFSLDELTQDYDGEKNRLEQHYGSDVIILSKKKMPQC